jgi:hypothetical protein
MKKLRLTNAGTCEHTVWEGGGGKRVLVEGPDAWALVEPLKAAGYDVATCRGPSEAEQCSLLESGTCSAAGEADAIVSGLLSTDGIAIVRALGEKYPNVPVVAEASPPLAAEYATAQRIVQVPADNAAVLDALAAVLAD